MKYFTSSDETDMARPANIEYRVIIILPWNIAERTRQEERPPDEVSAETDNPFGRGQAPLKECSPKYTITYARKSPDARYDPKAVYFTIVLIPFWEEYQNTFIKKSCCQN